MNIVLPYDFIDLFRDLHLIPKNLESLKYWALLSQQELNQFMMTRSLMVSSVEDVRFFAEYALFMLVKIDQRARERMLHHNGDLRTLRNWVARALLLCFAKIKRPEINSWEIRLFSNLHELSEFFNECKRRDVDLSHLVEQMSHFLFFEDCVLKAINAGDQREILRKSVCGYSKFAGQSTWLTGFLLIRTMADQFGLETIKLQVEEDLERLMANMAQ